MSVWSEQDSEEVRRLTRGSFKWGLIAGIPIGIVFAIAAMGYLAVMLGF
jgi:O-antigen/teichoic acid export membrane protein